MQDLNDFYYFVQVVDHSGFAAAGRALGLQKSLLSRRVAVLEDRLGVRLLQRSSRRFGVTEIGREFYTRCVAMLVEARSAEQIVAQNQAAPRGVVRLSCPVGLLSFQFDTLFARFLSENEAVTLHLESTNRQVDVIAEGFDLAIRVRFPPLEEIRVGHATVGREHAMPRGPSSSCPARGFLASQIAGLPSLGPGPAHRDHHWDLQHVGGQTASVPYLPRLVTDDLNALRAAAIQGLGIVQLPTVLVHEDVQAGRLIRLLADWRPRAGIIHAVFPSRRGLLPSVRALLDFLAGECAAHRVRIGR